MNNPLVSIIMAAKDTAPYLVECLKSIQNQTYQNWELIAINDHSSDDTPQILKTFASTDNRIKVVDSLRHKLIPALKEGYAVAQGTLINRMDSDDKMPPYKLEVMVSEWLKYGKGHIVAGGTSHFVDEGEVGGGFLRYEEWLNDIARSSTHYDHIYQECVIPSHCWILHKDDFDVVGAFNPEVYPEDYDLCFRFYKQQLKVIGIDQIVHFWRDRSDRISRTWEVYKDNRYFKLKLNYFFELDRDNNRPLVFWGAGRNGKDLVKKALKYGHELHWVCDSKKKIGKDIYGIKMEHFEAIKSYDHPQILIAIAGPEHKEEVIKVLNSWGKKLTKDYWLFL
ncbi:glycosyltransferase family 2 protein [Fulvivirga lutimaris]|uniref:glycosyltransferase family 2 protein n=1 Tax=Fulvivirga lutimaris TaxID=1819566 RepID=UPI0012BB6D76|nr:glycosyltransferase family 2 protein [Fulvivirga lutimaris]MTI41202.1 glycosyltransferase [Fulvivirga lutimaris]